ncbi:15029_t:CDS:2, partial [Rhizophagus irregularis]
MMNEELWDEYEAQSKLYFKYRFRYIDIDNITSQEDLDHAWNIFEHNITHSYELSLVGYLDDTTWFSPSLEKLELKLDIAHSFYDMAKIKVNIDKYKILTNQKLANNIKSTQLTINGRQTDVDIVPKYKGTRILGLYINPLDKHHQTLIKALKSQSNSLLALFNTDTLRPIAIQKLDILAQELWYPGIPQNINKYIGKISTPSYLSRSLALLEQYQIHLDLTVSYGIIGGHTPINVPERSLGSHKKHNEWTYHWNASIQNCVIGKTYLQDTDTHSSISTMEHYIPINNSLLVNNTSSQSLLSSPLILIPCTGCQLNDYSLVLQDARIKCSISIRTNRLSVFIIFHCSNQEHKQYANLHLKKYFYIFSINTITPTPTSLSANLHSSVNDDTVNQLILPIQSALLCTDFIKLSLIDIVKKFLPFTNFEFYSDSSVSDIGTINSRSGF